MIPISKTSKVVALKMRENGYTQQKMAILLGYTHKSAINQKLTGKRNWTLSDILLLRELFGFEKFDELF